MSNPETGPLSVDLVGRNLEAMRVILEKLLAWNTRPRPERVFTNIGSFNLDGSGNATVKLMDVQEGFEFQLNRLVLYPPASTPSSAMTVSYILVCEDDANGVRDFAPLPGGTASIPGLFTDNRHQAWPYRGGHSVVLIINGGTASANVRWAMKGYLTSAA